MSLKMLCFYIIPQDIFPTFQAKLVLKVIIGRIKHVADLLLLLPTFQ